MASKYDSVRDMTTRELVALWNVAQMSARMISTDRTHWQNLARVASLELAARNVATVSGKLLKAA